MNINKIIIAAYPGLGRRETVELLKPMATSIETKKYKYIGNEIHPEYPKNVVDLLEALEFETNGIMNYRDLSYIFTDIDKDVLQGLLDRGIQFVLILPKTEAKKEAIKQSVRKDLLDMVDSTVEELQPKVSIVIYADDLPYICNKPDFYSDTISMLRMAPDFWIRMTDIEKSGIQQD